MPVELYVNLVPARLQKLLLRRRKEGKCLSGRSRKVLKSLIAPAMGYPVAQLGKQSGQFATIPIEAVLHFLRDRTVQMLRHMATEHARVRVNGDVNLLGPQAGREYRHGQNCWSSLEVDYNNRGPGLVNIHEYIVLFNFTLTVNIF